VVSQTDGRLLRGDRTRTAVLDVAVALATEVGLDGLSLSQVADRLLISKSALFAHWRNKEELQLATVERARERYREHVVVPALKAPKGVRRLWALFDHWLTYITAYELPGGCFFTNTQFEYNARPGPIRDRLTESLVEWLALIERLAADAVAARELPESTDPRQTAFEINAVGVAVVYQSRLLPEAGIVGQARTAVLRRMRALCTDPTLLPGE
jgi:AcrR family transcriptional regulator